MSPITGRHDNDARLARTVVTCVIGATLFAARSSALAGQGVPADSSLIAVDFLAVDDRGRSVTDLRANEVVLRLGRETVELRTLKFLPAASDATRRASRDSGQPIDSTDAFDFERRFLVVIDAESLPQGSESATRDALTSFVRRLDSQDRVGFATVPRGGLQVPVTTDHGRVLQSVARISGRAQARESAADAACRSSEVLRALEGLLSASASPLSPLVVVFVSASMYDGGGAIQVPLGTVVACALQLSDFRQLGVRAAQSPSYIYIVQPETFATLPWTSNPRSGLEHLAGATGGRILQLSGRDVDLLDRVRSETSGLYLAVARLQSKPRAGTTQPMTIRTSRPGVSILSRPHLASAPQRSRSR